jgi:hypothetical protein
MAKKLIAGAMLGVVAILSALALGTLLPLGHSRANDLGYISLCPFAPWSTLMLGLGAVVIWAVRSYIVTRLD